VVSVQAQTRCLTLRVAPKRFQNCLDPLTLRLFNKLRPQLAATQDLFQVRVCLHCHMFHAVPTPAWAGKAAGLLRAQPCFQSKQYMQLASLPTWLD
jgi:hypothetical protein